MTTQTTFWTRRSLLCAGGGVLAAGALRCGSNKAANGSNGADAGREADMGSPPVGARWATGGTATLAASYPSPFENPEPQCVLTCAQTLGPCYATTLERQDISEGRPGLPMRLLIRVMRQDGCAPVSGATVDIWHTDREGIYSGQTASAICNPGTQDVSQERFFRGVQPTDSDGIARFDTVFPGWYPARTAHIHFTIRIANDVWVTSQLYFDDALSREIYQDHPDYTARGAAPVTNQNDGLIADGPIARWSRMDDGVLLSFATVAIRNALTDPAC